MNYVKCLAKQLPARGIRVNGVAPGPIWTPLQISGGAQAKKCKQFGSTAPMGRPGQPAELASIYAQLAASDGSDTTGNLYGGSREFHMRRHGGAADASDSTTSVTNEVARLSQPASAASRRKSSAIVTCRRSPADERS